MMQVKKVLIIGISGTGKTRLARTLSDALRIPVMHYDQLVWAKNWTEVDPATVRTKTEEILKNDQWIFEGYIHPAAQMKLEEADVVLYLDYTGFEAALGGFSRWWRHRGEQRPEMAEGCIERLDWKYLGIMWSRKERPEIEHALKGFEAKVVRLKSRKEADAFIESIRRNGWEGHERSLGV